MWTLTAPNLPQTATDPDRQPATLCIIGAGVQSPAVAQVDHLAKWRSPSVVVTWEPSTTVVLVPAATGSDSTITLTDQELVHIEVIHAGGQTFTPAVDPEHPKSGEFTYTTAIDPVYFDSMPTIATITLFGGSGSTSASIVGGRRSAAYPTNLVNNKVLGDLGRGLPMTGQLTWTLSLEQHPSGSLKLFCLADAAPHFRSYFAIGRSFKFAEIGFAASGYSEKYTKTGVCEISVSLTGSWARSSYNRAVFLRKGSQISEPSASPAEVDPDCGIDPSNQGDSNRKDTVTLSSLASQVGVSLQLDGNYWSIKIEPDTPKDASQNWISLLHEMSRPNTCCIDWTNYEYVSARSVDNATIWHYTVNEIEATYQGDTLHSANYIGYSAELKNVELTGNFSHDKKQAKRQTVKNQPPTWTPRSPKIVTLTSGDPNPTLPPDNVVTLKTLSLNFDSSGPTKTVRITTTQDGQPFQVIEIIYGFLFTALEIYDPTSQSLVGSPAAHWQVVSYKVQTYNYDGQYGYPIGYDTIGFKYARVAQESDDLRETLFHGPPPDGETETPDEAIDRVKRLNLYKFQQIPVIEKNRIQHHSYAGYYSDASEDPNWVSYKYCNRDGTSEIRYVPDPTWAPPVFAKDELTFASAFNKLPNPDFDPTQDYGNTLLFNSQNPPPPKYKITGEESLHARSLSIKARSNSPYGDSITYTPANGIDLFTERVFEGSAQNADFKDFVVRESFTENEGKPSPSTRLPPTQERKQEQEQTDGDPNQKQLSPKQYRYTICSPGYEPTDPIDGSMSFINATTPELAANGADTDLKIKDIQESASYKAAIPFNADLRPLDFVFLKHSGTGAQFDTRITSVQNTIDLYHDEATGGILATWQPSQITAGPNRTIPTILSKKLLPQANSTSQPKTKQNILIVGDQQELTIGSLFDVSKLQSRGNF